MKHFELNASLRTDLGKKACKKIRKEKNIPCVLYGGEETIHFQTSQSNVRKLVYTPEVMFANIDLNGKKYDAVIKDIQFHAVSDQILHIDFLQIFPDKALKIKIPVVIVGNSPGVKSGGKLKKNLRSLTVKGLMNDIPDTVEVSISKLKVNQSIRIKDLVSDTLEFVDNKSMVVVSVESTRGVALIEDDEDEAAESTEEAAE